MDDFIDTIERFLTYSDQKLEELAQKNRQLRQQASGENEQKKHNTQ